MEVEQISFRSFFIIMEQRPVQKHSRHQPMEPHNRKFVNKFFFIRLVFEESDRIFLNFKNRILHQSGCLTKGYGSHTIAYEIEDGI